MVLTIVALLAACVPLDEPAAWLPVWRFAKSDRSLRVVDPLSFGTTELGSLWPRSLQIRAASRKESRELC